MSFVVTMHQAMHSGVPCHFMTGSYVLQTYSCPTVQLKHRKVLGVSCSDARI